MFEAHDALICIKEKTHVIVNERRRLTPEHYFKSPEEMKKLFDDLPEAVANTVVIAKRCGFMVENSRRLCRAIPTAATRQRPKCCRNVRAPGWKSA